MKIDFHSHANLTKNVDFHASEFKEKIKEAKDSGLDAVALTEHFNTSNFKEIYKQLSDHFPYVRDHYNIEGFKVFTGIEIDIQEIGHILFIGNRKDILQVFEQLVPHIPVDNHIPFRDLLAIAREFNLLKIGAHPLRKKTPLKHLDHDLLKQLDAFDLNATDIFRQGIEIREGVETLARTINLPVVAGSDTHHYLQYGSVYNTFPDHINTVGDLKNVINEGNYEINISPCLKDKVKGARLIKKEIKNHLTIKS